MKNFLLGGAAAAVMLAVAPAIAQTGAPTPQAQAAQTAAPKAAKVHSRAEVQAKVAKHFGRLDADGDGFVTKAEMEAAKTQMRAKMTEWRATRVERSGDLFDRLDTNRDGAISRAEFDAMRQLRMSRRGNAAAPRMMMRGMHVMGGRMFEMADANKDGRVSLEEATNAALHHFDMADTNRDGQVTPDERRQMHQKMMSEHHPG